MDELRWALAWEDEIPDAQHAELAVMLARAYPRYAELFRGGRSWSGARPELRVVGTVGDRPIAHLGLLRRFLRVPDTGASLLVGDVGLVAVDPEFHGMGVGRQLLDHATRAMTDLALPFGFLTCGRQVVPFYRSGGWRLIDGQVTRMIAHDGRRPRGSHQAETSRAPAMVLPVRAPISEWPYGCLVDRNGLEV